MARTGSWLRSRRRRGRLGRAARRVDTDLPAGGDTQLAVGDHAVARLHSARHDDEIALPLSEGDRADLGRRVVLYHEDEEALRGGRGRRRRDQDSAPQLTEDEPDVDE